jgi:hypothetical protein
MEAAPMTYPAPENPDTDYSLRSDLIDLTERALAIHFLFTREAAQRLVAHRRTHGRQRRHDQRELTP